jgi:hypothetical protein
VENVVVCATVCSESSSGGWEGCSSSVAMEVRSRISLSRASVPRGSAIPVPGVLIGNSSSSGIGMGFEMVLPLIEAPVFALAGLSARHFAAALGFIVTKFATQRTFLLPDSSTGMRPEKGMKLKRTAFARQISTSRHNGGLLGKQNQRQLFYTHVISSRICINVGCWEKLTSWSMKENSQLDSLVYAWSPHHVSYMLQRMSSVSDWARRDP